MNQHTSPDLETRFWSKVEKGRDPPEHVRDDLEDDCWIWTAGTSADGYGSFSVNGANQRAHRVSVRLDGTDVGDEHVLHHCDNRRCVNPSHLYVGTHAQNMRDAYERTPERMAVAPGENNANAKLSDADVRRLRERYAASEDVSHRDLGDEYGVARGHVGYIVRGEKRQTAPGPVTGDTAADVTATVRIGSGD